MKFSIPVEIGFQVLDRFIKEGVIYSKALTENEEEISNIELEVDDECVDQATDIVNEITGGQRTRSQRFQSQPGASSPEEPCRSAQNRGRRRRPTRTWEGPSRGP